MLDLTLPRRSHRIDSSELLPALTAAKTVDAGHLSIPRDPLNMVEAVACPALKNRSMQSVCQPMARQQGLLSGG